MADTRRAVDVAFTKRIGQGDGSGWGVYMPDEGGVHVMPEFGPTHQESTKCWCHPDVEQYADDELVTHNVGH